MAITRIDGAFEVFVKRYLRSVHTSVPCTIVGVDLSAPSVDVQPTVSTDFGDDWKPETYPTIYDVPLHVYSANAGQAKLTVPVKVGDKAALHFSERNPNSKTDLSTHGMYSCYAVSGLEGEIDPDKIVIKNQAAEMTFAPDGTTTLKNSTANIIVQPDGNVKVNGLTITTDGNVITASGVNLNNFYQAFLSHTHHYKWTDGEGESDTNAPN